jgi:hypothetical protein
MRLEMVMKGLMLSQRQMKKIVMLRVRSKNSCGMEKWPIVPPIQTIFLRFLKIKQETEELVA